MVYPTAIMAYMPPMVSPLTSCCRNKHPPLDAWKDAGIQKFRRLYYSISNYLSNYSADTNLPFLTILTKAGLVVSPFLSK